MIAPRTAKGERTAARVLQAATTVLARDGYGGATLGRIAEEAGVDKPNVLYYYASRDVLLVRAVETIGEQIAANIGQAAAPGQAPRELAASAVAAMWSGVTSVPEPSRAYFALIGGGAGAPVVEAALLRLKAAFLAAITDQLNAIDATRWRLRDSPESVAGFGFFMLRGLLLEWTESGDGPLVDAGLARFREALEREFVPVG
ncbi:MAG: TetR/AcrR family transcriptional regulator [Solirubrobacterales bacterium]|nr:TetR/AcrR family transcriptional regulator [Solirubrobacterales bacterium]